MNILRKLFSLIAGIAIFFLGFYLMLLGMSDGSFEKVDDVRYFEKDDIKYFAYEDIFRYLDDEENFIVSDGFFIDLDEPDVYYKLIKNNDVYYVSGKALKGIKTKEPFVGLSSDGSLSGIYLNIDTKYSIIQRIGIGLFGLLLGVVAIYFICLSFEKTNGD